MTGQSYKTEDTVSTPNNPTIFALFPEECNNCGNFGLTITTRADYEAGVCCDCMTKFIDDMKEKIRSTLEK